MTQTLKQPFRDIGPMLTRLGVALSHPGAFVGAITYVGTWSLLSPATFDWHAGATIAALFMTLFIQRATHRDTQALLAKVDELLHVNRSARDDLITVDDEEPEDIEEKASVRDAPLQKIRKGLTLLRCSPHRGVRQF